MKTYLIKKIFGPTLQGEGTWTGTAVKFVRFSGCNKWNGLPKGKENSVCFFCDTDFYGGDKLTSSQIADQLNLLGPCKTVVLSGGEPTLQLDIDLILTLQKHGYKLHLETNGSKNIDLYFDLLDHVTVSPKQPPQQTNINKAHDLKILYPSPIRDVDPAKFDEFDCINKFIQPLEDKDWDANTKKSVEFCTSNPGWRLSLQVHKILGVE